MAAERSVWFSRLCRHGWNRHHKLPDDICSHAEPRDVGFRVQTSARSKKIKAGHIPRDAASHFKPVSMG
jgi:hypothetical protein